MVQLLSRSTETSDRAETLQLDSRSRARSQWQPHLRSNGGATDGVAANGAVVNGAVADGAVVNGAVADGAVVNGAVASGAVAHGAVANRVAVMARRQGARRQRADGRRPAPDRLRA